MSSNIQSVSSDKADQGNQKNQLLKFSDFIPIFKSCIYLIFFIILFSFSLIYIFYKISPDMPNTVYYENISNIQNNLTLYKENSKS